jgi:hypothetical protein
VRVCKKKNDIDEFKLCRSYGGPGQKYGDYRPSDAEGPLKHRIKIAHTR